MGLVVVQNKSGPITHVGKYGVTRKIRLKQICQIKTFIFFNQESPLSFSAVEDNMESRGVDDRPQGMPGEFHSNHSQSDSGSVLLEG